MKEKTIAYIKTSLEKGMLEAEIRKNLLIIGLTEKEVNGYFRDYKNSTTTPGRCPECGQEFPKWEDSCWRCGFDPKTGKKKKQPINWNSIISPIAKATIILAILLAAFFLLPYIQQLGSIIPSARTIASPPDIYDPHLDMPDSIHVPYGVSTQYLEYDQKRIRLDVYNPGVEGCPAVILIHGSAGISGDRAVRYREFATGLMKRGILAINMHYFESPNPRVYNREWERTTVKTITYAQRISNVDKNKIGLIGYSLGGSIALYVSSKDDRISVIAVNAPPMPSRFTEEDAKKLPTTLILAGTKDKSAYDALKKIKGWRDKNELETHTREDPYGHNDVPMDVFEAQWKDIEDFMEKQFKKQKI
jgi:dienelactone hydrolase